MEKNVLYIEKFANESYRFAWTYDERIKELIQARNNGNYKWKKGKNNVWYIEVYSNADASSFTDIFLSQSYKYQYKDNYNGKDDVIEEDDKVVDNNIKDTKEQVSHISELTSNIDYITTPEIINVQRNEDYTNKLSVFVPDSLVNTMNNLDYVKRVKRTNEYLIFIEDIIKLYNELRSIQKHYQFKGIAEWVRIVNEWGSDYAPVPLNSRFEPYPFQLEDVDILLRRHKCILGNDMGCGKTHESVRVGMSLPMKKLIICPASLRLNWEREINIVDADAEIEVIYSNTKKINLKEWNIIGYSSVEKHYDTLNKAHIQCIFVDEAHFCQAVANSGKPSSKRALAVLKLTATAGWVYPITGTPITNRNKNLYNILQMINHPLTRRDNAFFTYGKQYCDGKRNKFGWNFEGNSNSEELHFLINSYMIRHLKSEVLPNLKKQRQSIPLKVNLNGYNKALKEYFDSRDNEDDDKTILSLLMKARMSLAKEKVSESIDLASSIIQNNNQIIIATCFTAVVEEVEKVFKDNVCKIVGGMSDIKKQEAVDMFQSGQKQVMVLNIDAGGVGITLTASHIMIINDLPWTTGQLTQVEDRICRTGQTAEYSIIYYMTAIGAVVEEKMVNSLTSKSNNINTVVDGGDGEELDFINLVKNGLN